LLSRNFDCHDGTKVQKRDYDGLEYLCRKFLEPLRTKFGSVHINSGFRTTAYNRSIGGASNSFHVYTAHDGNDQAADVTCARGNRKGGLGLYSSFVHCDIRDEKADWRG
jgi:uncharacterized protein YcbK (DUF882 family)